MKTARKLLALLLVLVMCLCMLTACGEKSDTDSSSDKDDEGTTTSTTSKKPLGNGPISGLLDTITENEADPEEEPYDAIARAWGLTVQDAGAAYLSMLDAIPSIVDGTATYEIAMDMDGQQIGLNAVVDPENLKASAEASINVQGISTEATLWLGDDIAVSAPDLLGNKAYGVKLSTLLDDLNGSWLLGLTGFSSAEDMLASLLEESGLSESMAELEAILDELTALEDALTDSITKASEAFAEGLEKELGELNTEVTTANGSTVLTTVVTSNDAADIALLALDFVDALYADALSAFIPNGLGLDEAREDLNDMRGEEGEMLIIHTLAADGSLQKFVFGFRNPDGEQAELVTIVFNEGDGFGFEVLVEETSIATFEALSGDLEGFELTIADEGTIRFERNVKSGDFTLAVKEGGTVITEIKGNLQYGSDKFAFELDSVTADGQTQEVGMKIAMKAGGKVKALPNYQNVLDMSESQMQALLTDIQNSSLLQDILAMDNRVEQNVAARPNEF